MMSGDGMVIRVRAPFGQLSQQQAACVAKISDIFGNGLIDLSTRANLQIRGIAEKDHAKVIEELSTHGLVDQSIEVEARRNLLSQPFWRENDETHRIAKALSALLSAFDAPELPGKFGFAVDAGPVSFLRKVSADIRIERHRERFTVYPDGGTLAQLANDPQSAADAAMDLARWFVKTGGVIDGRGRMAQHIRNGIPLPPQFQTVVAGDPPPEPGPGKSSRGRFIALEFGQISAPVLREIASLGKIRLTPWKMLLILGLEEAPDLPGLIHDFRDPRLRIDVCTGAPGCLQGRSATRTLARDLAAQLPRNQRLHISGCAKGCAHPRQAPITLTASDNDRFNLIRDGRASDAPERINLSPDDIKKALQNAP